MTDIEKAWEAYIHTINEIKASLMYKDGDQISYSKGICGQTTAGFGKLSDFGYFEYPLIIDHESGEIICPGLENEER